MVLAEVTVHRDSDGRRTIVPVGEEVEIPCELALLAIGFEGPEHGPLLDDYGIERNRRGVIGCGPDWQTSAPGVFVCGDAHRGASLVVWAIAEGRVGRERGRRVPDGQHGAARPRPPDRAAARRRSPLNRSVDQLYSRARSRSVAWRSVAVSTRLDA